MTSSRWTSADLPSLDQRTVVVTGANSGLGLIAARELARAGARVVLAVRDTARGEQAARSIAGATEVRELDLADLASITTFADGWHGELDILINNAGVMAVPERRTKDGFELQIGTNHLGHFALTNLLLAQITDRVVTVSSTGHRIGRIRLDDLNWEQGGYGRWAAYGQSKLANLLFTLELQRRLDEAGSAVRAHAAHPGYAATNLQGHTGSGLQHRIMAITNRLLAQSDEMGALPTLYAATQDLPGASFIAPADFRSSGAIRHSPSAAPQPGTPRPRAGCGSCLSSSRACRSGWRPPASRRARRQRRAYPGPGSSMRRPRYTTRLRTSVSKLSSGRLTGPPLGRPSKRRTPPWHGQMNRRADWT